MKNKQDFFDLISPQRYFHLVAFKFEAGYSTQAYWKDSQQTIVSVTSYDTPDFKIEYAKIKSTETYFTGIKDYSVNKDGKSPFNYDLFVIELKSENLFVFGFPFKGLAKTIVEHLLSKQFLERGKFIKTDLNKLIRINHEASLSDEYFSAHFSGVQLKLTGDLNITSVNLDGDMPLDSMIYKTFFKEKIQEGNPECKLEKCSHKCGTILDSDTIPKAKSNIHSDTFGNYRMYVHSGGNNIFTIPFFFNLLENVHCTVLTSSNPIERLNESL
jgi:hypothetical protein